MKRSAAGLFFVAVMVLIASIAYAGSTTDPGIRQRLVNQQQRIDQGAASVELTRDGDKEQLRWSSAYQGDDYHSGSAPI